MSNLLVLAVLLFVVTQVEAQTVTVSAPGVVTWTDRSAGKATTEIKISTDEPPIVVTVEPGITELSIVPIVRNSKSAWLCIQARHLYPDGTVSPWFISENEGVCKRMDAVLPPVVVPPPVIPPVIPAVPLTNVMVKGHDLTFDYKTADCPKGIQMASGKIVNGKRTVTMTCRK